MFRLKSKLIIGDYVLKGVNAFSISESWDKNSSIGSVVIPRNIQFEGQGIDSLFKKGTPIQLEAGYDNNIFNVFQGVISRVMPEKPLVFEIQDYMWYLKQININETFRSITVAGLVDLLQTKLNDLGVEQTINFEITAETTLNKLRIVNRNGAEVLEDLRKYGIYSFFRGDTCYTGLARVPDLQSTHNIVFERNVISDNLEYQEIDDVKIRLKAISVDSLTNKQTEITIGSRDGALRTLYFYNLSESDLEKAANENIEKFRYTGFSGSFTTFGQTRINHGDIINLSSNLTPEHNGTYLVKTVVTTISYDGGYRQKVELDTKI